MLLSPASFIKTYGYATILQPLIDDLINLETIGIKVELDRIAHMFTGSLSMMIADNLAAHAIGGYYCNFSTVQRFCRFCMLHRSSLNTINDVAALRTKDMYNDHVKTISADPSLSSLYGITKNSCLNQLAHFHVASGLPPDLAHDVLEGFAKDLTKNVIVQLIKDNVINLTELKGKRRFGKKNFFFLL